MKTSKQNLKIIGVISLNEWYETNEGKWSSGHKTTIRYRLDKFLMPSLGHIPIKNITSSQIVKSFYAALKIAGL